MAADLSPDKNACAIEAICGPSQLVKIDDGQSVHVRTAGEWLDLARRDLEAARSHVAMPIPPVGPVAAEVIKALHELADGYVRDPMGEKQELTIFGRTMRESIVAQALARLSAGSTGAEPCRWPSCEVENDDQQCQRGCDTMAGTPPQFKPVAGSQRNHPIPELREVSLDGETPRTDACFATWESLRILCRQLERELAEANRLRQLDAKSRQALIAQADGYEDRALKAEAAPSSTPLEQDIRKHAHRTEPGDDSNEGRAMEAAASSTREPINLAGVTGDEMDKSAERAALLTRLMAAGEPRLAAEDRVVTINNIERFHAGDERLEPDPDGPWVRFSDAAAISNRLASAAPSAIERPSGWIKASERLPDDTQNVIAYYVNSLGNGRRIRAFYAKQHQIEDTSDDGMGSAEEHNGTTYIPAGWYETNEAEEYYYRADGNVTHWQPLPSAPDGCTTDGTANK